MSVSNLQNQEKVTIKSKSEFLRIVESSLFYPGDAVYFITCEKHVNGGLPAIDYGSVFEVSFGFNANGEVSLTMLVDRYHDESDLVKVDHFLAYDSKEKAAKGLEELKNSKSEELIKQLISYPL